MIISRGDAADLAEILALEPLGFPASERWSEPSWLGELTAADRCVLVAKADDGRLAGVASFQVVTEVADLNRVVVHPDRRGRGVAGALIREGLAWAAGTGAERMLLEVRVDNKAAVGLYRRWGFLPLTRRADYYGPGEHALVMARDLDGSAVLTTLAPGGDDG